MNKKLYIGNLDWEINDDKLGQFFSQSGTILDAKVILNRETGRSRGFGFVEFETEDEAKHAIEHLNEKELGGRIIVVRQARPEGSPQIAKKDHRGNIGCNCTCMACKACTHKITKSDDLA